MRASVPQPVASRVTSTAFVTSAALLTIVASVVILMVAMTRRTYDMLGAFLLVLALFAATVPIARRIARQEGDPSMVRLIMLALACKLVGSLLRYYVIFTVYGGNADAYTYHLGGAHFAHALQRGTFVMPSGHGIGTQMHEEPQVPNYIDRRNENPRLKEGMVLAIEPMVNAGGPDMLMMKNKWTAVTKDGAFSAHFEHCVAVTENGPWVLTRP